MGDSAVAEALIPRFKVQKLLNQGHYFTLWISLPIPRLPLNV